MKLLLHIAAAIDGLNERVGHAVYWLVLVAVLISAGNAVVRYLFNTSSNAWLEAQWYLSSAIFLLASGYTLLRNEHIRIDIVVGNFSAHTQAWIDILGGVLFLTPMCLVMIWLSWPMFAESFARGEMSTDAGGLLRWPVKLLIPVGFSLLLLQGVAETIKRIAFVAGVGPDPAAHREQGAALPHGGRKA